MVIVLNTAEEGCGGHFGSGRTFLGRFSDVFYRPQVGHVRFGDGLLNCAPGVQETEGAVFNGTTVRALTIKIQFAL